VLYDAATGKIVHTLVASGTGSVFSVAFTPDGGQVITGSGDGIARMWKVATGRSAEAMRSFGEAPDRMRVLSVAVSADGTYLLTGRPDGTAMLWDAATGKLVQTFSLLTRRPIYPHWQSR
jgi:WD40 repeat protein